MIENAISIADAIAKISGTELSIKHRRHVSGGDINEAAIITLSDDSQMFLKENRADLVLMFAAEAKGLMALGQAGIPPVPQPLGWGRDGRRSFLLLEVVESGRLESAEDFGLALAHLHRHLRNEKCGFSGDNWIGSTSQINTPMSSWFEFFAECRLGYQWRLARMNGYGDKALTKAMESLQSRLIHLLPDLDGGMASLLHGDLWGGNWMAGADGQAYLIDPAVYYGHREADLAMTRLFGGFPGGFYQSYVEAWPIEAGFSERIPLYNLYHLLNHLNLFGTSYMGRVRDILFRYA